jgi:putative membrane protein
MNVAQTIPLADTWMHGGGWGWGWMTLMMIPMLLFWGAVVFGIFWLIRGTARSDWGPGEAPVKEESPVEILDRRFAEGAITPEEYRARREVLLNGSAGSNGARSDEPLKAPEAAEGRRR